MPPPHDSATLKDGSRITIRPISPDDRQALGEGFERLSPESRYRRFFGPVTHLSERELDYLTQIDHHDHEALVALDAASGDGVAVARFIRLDEDAAEPAIVVVDDWQHRGVAGHLLDALAARAREEGIRRFVAPVLAENSAAISAFRRLGATSHGPMGPEIELTVDLTEPRQAQPVMREVLRAVASGVVEPARGLWELLLRALPAPPGFGESIIVAIDDTEACPFAVDCAGGLSARLKLPVQLIAAYRPLLDDATAIKASLQDAERRLREQGVEITSWIGRGDPALSVLYAATRERAGLIIVGSASPDEPGPILSSSVWNAVAHNSHCNVLIARAR
jgi:nucleotide-binding universal stress UspA family protein/RimJ/RimL family protein N-acetyltransferase